MRAPDLVWLDTAESFAASVLGGKAHNLVAMQRAGFPVPPGFCLTTHAYAAYLASQGLTPTASVEQLRSAFADDHYPSPLRDSILDAVQRLGAASVAVRSSATTEDLPAASFAGQQATYLNVQGAPAVLQAIRQCWASLWTERAIAYRQGLGDQASEPRMAVVVQAMIPCEVAGVAFSLDPLTAADTLVIEAHRGLGENVVSGLTTVDRYLVDRATSRITNPTGQSLLTPAQIHQLAELVLGLERLLERPQDVEWGFWNGTWHWFQSRPITVSGRSFFTDVIPGDDQVWTSGFVNERFPQPVSPLGWTLVRGLLEPLAFRDPLRFMGAPEALASPLTKLYRGHPFLNVRIFQTFYKPFPESWLPEDARRFFPGGDTKLRRGVRYPCCLVDPRFVATMLWHFAHDPANWSPFHNHRHWAAFVAQHDPTMDRLEQRTQRLETEGRRNDEYRDVTPAWAILTDAQSLNARLLAIHRWSLIGAELFYSLLRRMLSAWLGPARGHTLAVQLTTGLPNKSMELNQALHSCQSEEEWQAFMERYGHRSFSLDIYHPTFRDQPEEVKKLATLAPHVSKRIDPAAQREAALVETNQALRSQAWGWWKVKSVNWVLAYARCYLPLREDQRFYWQKTLALQRRVCLWIGGRLTESGRLESPEEVFFATLDELRDAVAGRSLPRQEINRRRIEYTRLQEAYESAPHLSYPDFLRGNQPLVDPQTAGATMLRGQPVSPGWACGPVRIVATPGQFDRIRKGDILVTHGADPGWTVVFERIAGLVMEVGGQLSHGAVVAREYGLPAITAIPNATQRLQDGEVVVIDGLAGTISRGYQSRP